MSKRRFEPWALTEGELATLTEELAKDLTADIDAAEKLIFAATKKAFDRAHSTSVADTFEGLPS